MQDRIRLGALTAIILIAHLWLLQSRNGDIYLKNAVTTSAFSTRQIDASPPASGISTQPLQTRPQRALTRRASKSSQVETAKPDTDPTQIASTADASRSPQDPAQDPRQDTASEVQTSTLTVGTATLAMPTAVAAEASAAAANPQLSLRVPGSRRLKYAATGEARKLRYGADAELLWLHDGASYAARLEVGAFLLGKRVQTSAGALGDTGLAPKRFSDKARTEVAAHFERTKGVVVFSANTPDAPLLPGAQDRLSVLLQLSALLAGAPERYPAGARFVIQTVGPRESESWQFVVEDDETLALKEGALSARKLQRQPQRDFDMKVEVWLAPALDWLPVQVKLTQANGDFVQLALESAEKP